MLSVYGKYKATVKLRSRTKHNRHLEGKTFIFRVLWQMPEEDHSYPGEYACQILTHNSWSNEGWLASGDLINIEPVE